MKRQKAEGRRQKWFLPIETRNRKPETRNQNRFQGAFWFPVSGFRFIDARFISAFCLPPSAFIEVSA